MRNKSPKIAVLSGKGGTGKTLVSVNLASVAGESLYIDCDVEEPNGHLFFKPERVCEEGITVKVPEVNEDLCGGCRKCADFCKVHAIAFIKDKPYVFEELCHSCGGCALFCPDQAIDERERVVGRAQRGISGGVRVSTGVLNTGEASGIPIIKRLLEPHGLQEGLPVFIDCPPGSACAVMESLQGADFCLLVGEPTLFGVHNLRMVHDLVRLFGKPEGVVLNKCLAEENPAELFCLEKNIPILGRIQFDNELGKLNSDGRIAARERPRFRKLFASLLEEVMKEVGHETAAHTQR